jgi:recombination associated protein RdgC
MWFRNLLLYRLLDRKGLSPEHLEKHLAAHPFRPCRGMEPQSLGWEPPLGRTGQLLTHAANGCVLICARREERILPAAVVREALETRVAEIEAAEARTVRRRERQQLKEEIVVDLLPRAFTRSRRLFAYLDPRDGWLVVDSALAKQAEELLTLLRESLGSLKVRPAAVAQSPAALMTRWVRRRPPRGWQLADECELREPLENGGIVRCRRQALDGAEIGAHLEAGKQVVRLALEWQQRLSFVLADDLVVRRLKFLDLIQEEAAAVAADDAVARFDADFALMTLELKRFLPALVEVCGGLAS